MMGRRRAAVLGSARRLYFVQDRLGRYQAKARDGRVRNTRGPMLASTPPYQPPGRSEAETSSARRGRARASRRRRDA